MADSYGDEIDLYGDADDSKAQSGSGSGSGGAGQQSSYGGVSSSSNHAVSSIPTFISEARGGTGVIPPRDDYGDESNSGGPGGGLSANANLPARVGGGYGGDQGQWKASSTGAASSSRPSEGGSEEGKMFVGGLNWETTEESMRKYFEQFGEVTQCTIMRDPQTNRSRGFGFLTFRDASAVNVVMVKEHHLDGKIIDPKRAIPRPDVGTVRQDKIFVRHVPQTMDVYKFREYFSQYGSILESNLMMDRETGLHRGFGFVTYDDPSSVQSALSQSHEWDGQQLEVKMATQKRNREDTYVGDRPLQRRQQYGGGYQGGPGGGQYNNNNNNANMGGMGGMMGQYGGGGGMGPGGMGNNMMGNMGGGMGGMPNPMGGGMGMGMNQQGAFDPFAMAQFFKQMGWGQFNPMMFGGMMGGDGMMGGGNMNMMQPGMMNMMGGMGGMPNNMGGMGMGMNPNMGGFGGGNFSGAGGMNMAGSPGMGVGMGQQDGSNINSNGTNALGGNSGSGNGNASPPNGGSGQAQAGQGSASANGDGNVGTPSGSSGNNARPPPAGPRSQSRVQDTKPPPNAPTGPRAGSGGAGPMRSQRAGGGAGHHPYR